MLRQILSPLTLLLALAIVLGACKDDSTTDKAAIEAQKKVDEALVQRFVAAQRLTATRTASGLYYVQERPGTGAQATAGKRVTVHYRGYLINDSVETYKFDSSYDRAQPISFLLGNGQVIAGWDEGIALMKKGEKAQLIIPSYLAYGTTGSGAIPSNAVLSFHVELLDIQ